MDSPGLLLQHRCKPLTWVRVLVQDIHQAIPVLYYHLYDYQ